MNIEFKVLWFEDDPDWLESSERELNEVIMSHELEPKISKQNGIDLDIKKLITNDYDLILMDYALAEDNTGDQIISAIRNGDVLTDILFYSGQYEEMIKSVVAKPEAFDGVYFSRRIDDFFNPKVEKLINKIVRRSEDVVNLRGIVLDNTSEFELKMKQIMELVWPKISEHQNDLREYTKKTLTSSQTSLDAKYKEAIDAECCFMSALQSKGYILDSSKKAQILNRIVDILKDKYGFTVPNGYENIAKKYNEDILIYRNALGHVSSKDKTIILNKNNTLVELPVDMSLHRTLRISLKGFSDLFDQITDFITDKM